MSIDLDWLQLSTLSTRLVDSLNRQLKSTERPSFIGPITIHSFDFGTTPPDIELVDVRDIYRDFLEEDDNEEEVDSSDGASGSPGSYEVEDGEWNGSLPGSTQFTRETPQRGSVRKDETLAGPRADPRDKEEDFEWVGRRGTGRGVAETGPSYHPFPPHVRYGGASSTSNILDSTNPLVYSRSWDLPPFGISNSQGKGHGRGQSDSVDDARNEPPSPVDDAPRVEAEAAPSVVTAFQVNPSLEPRRRRLDPVETENDLQFHLRVLYHSDMRISISTSLLLNYPAPLFMALPIRLSIVGFEFNGEVVVAYQPSRKRVHVCVLDDEDPYRPATSSNERVSGAPLQKQNEREKVSPGARLLPHIFIESEIGQADKQVLRNVSRVEKFLQDMMRMTLEQELVFPNYQTIIYGEEE